MTKDVEDLLNALENGTREDIWEAAKGLVDIALGMYLYLIRVLENPKNAEARAAAAYALGFGNFASARAALEQVLGNAQEEAFVRGQAAEALAEIQSGESVDLLLKHLGHSNPEVKYWCIFALGRIGDSKAVPALTRIAESIGDEFFGEHSLRVEALDALDGIARHLKEISLEEKEKAG